MKWVHVVLLSLGTCLPVCAHEFIAGTLDGQTIRLVFPGPVSKASVENITNYSLALVRKEVKELSTNEIADLVAAMVQMKSIPSAYQPLTNAYDYFPEIHLTASSDHAGIHRSPLFLPWHREFLRRFESELRRASGNPLMTLPYWDWSDHSSTNLVFSEQFLGGDGDPNDHGFVKTGPFRVGQFPINVLDPTDDEFDDEHGDLPLPGKIWLTRGFGKDDDLEELPTPAQAQDALNPTRVYDVYPWDDRADPARSFRNYLEGWRRIGGSKLHNRVHLWVGGEMQSGASPNDPVFFLNHANVDRLWSHWHTLYGSSTYPESFIGPHMLGFPAVPVESTFEIQDSGLRYSSETPKNSLVSAELQPDNRTVLLTVTNMGNYSFGVAILGVDSLSGTNFKGTTSGRAYRLSATGFNNTTPEFFAEGDEIHLKTDGISFYDQSFSLLHQHFQNDFDVEVRVEDLPPFHQAGLVAISPLTNIARGLAFYRLGSSELQTVSYRQNTNSVTQLSPSSDTWLRLARTGEVIKAFTSSNHTHWTLVHTEHVGPGALRVGVGAAPSSGNQSNFTFKSFGKFIPVPRAELIADIFDSEISISWYSFDEETVLQTSTNLLNWTSLDRSMHGHNEVGMTNQNTAFFRLLRSPEVPGHGH